MTSFEELLQRARHILGTDAKLAAVLGISASRVSRAKRGEYPTLNVVNCLRLAEAMGESPSFVLRSAGKGEVADLLERLYGKAGPAVPPADRQHLDRWNALPTDVQRELNDIIVRLVPKPAAKKKSA